MNSCEMSEDIGTPSIDTGRPAESEHPSAANVRGHSVESSGSHKTTSKRRRRGMKYTACFRCSKHIRAKCSSRRESSAARSTTSSSHEDRETPVLQKMLSPDYSSIRKITWCVISVICSVVCLWQLGDRIKHYFSEPIMYQVDVVHQHEVKFPTITLCPAREPLNDSRWKKETVLSRDNGSLSEIWAENELKVNDSLFMYGACNEDQSVCDFDAGVTTYLNTSSLSTYYGNCLTILPGRPTEYRGASTFLGFALLPGPFNRNWFGQDIAAQFYFQESGSRHRHEAFYLVEWLKLYHETYVHLSLKQFNFLNSSKSPCDNEPAVTECRNKCADKMLDDIVNCSLPFMVSKWPPCSTVEAAQRAMLQSRKFYHYFSYVHCNCRRQCVDMVYSYNVNSAGRHTDNWTSLTLQFADNLIENVTETYAYSFSALVSDIGGGLGFFLGVSILSLFKAFESVVDTLHAKKKS